MQPILPPRMTTAITSKEDANTLYNPSSPSCQLSLPSLPSLAAYPSATAESAWLFISFSFSLQVSISSFKMHFLLYSESQSYYLMLIVGRYLFVTRLARTERTFLFIFFSCAERKFLPNEYLLIVLCSIRNFGPILYFLLYYAISACCRRFPVMHLLFFLCLSLVL